MTASALMWLGTYERDYSRTRVLHAGLRELGVEVVECHRPLWERTRHKAGGFLSPLRLPATAARFVVSWALLARKQRHVGRVDAVIAGYPAQPDAPLAAICAHARRVPLVVDAMISLSDTLSGDRARVGSVAGRSLEWLDRLSTRRAGLVITDTAAHRRWFVERFDVPDTRIGVVPVGAEPELFPRASESVAAERALFYGKLSPLHGLETVLAAARMPDVPPIRLIGDGQLGPWLDSELARSRPPGLERERWVPYESLGRELASSAICLGIFGTSPKAARVVPNKVYQAMAVGRAIVTADTPAARELLVDGRDALLVPAGDAEALAAALRRLGSDPEVRSRLGESAHRRFLDRGTPRVVARAFADLLSGVIDARAGA